jgi:hypothetical protein
LRLDYDLERGLDRKGHLLGQPIAIADGGRHIAGFRLLND